MCSRRPACAAIAAAYYLRLVSAMYFRPAARVIPDAHNPGPVLAAVLCMALVVGGGLFAGPMLNSAQSAGRNVLQGTTVRDNFSEVANSYLNLENAKARDGIVRD